MRIKHYSADQLAAMPPARLQVVEAKAQAVVSAVCDEMIAAGRGHERASETFLLGRTIGDPLAVRYTEASDALRAVRAECERRERYHGSLKRIVVRT